MVYRNLLHRSGVFWFRLWTGGPGLPRIRLASQVSAAVLTPMPIYHGPDDQSPANLLRRQRLYREACATSARLPPMTPTGCYGLWQRIDGRWSATGTLGYETRADAEGEVARLSSLQPNRWLVRDRHSLVDPVDLPPPRLPPPSIDDVVSMLAGTATH